MRNIRAGLFIFFLLCPALCSASPGAKFPVNNYGADPTGVKDSTAAITQAIELASNYTAQNPGHSAQVVFGNGRYKVECSNVVGSDSGNSNQCFSVQADNLTITGQGAKKSVLILENAKAGAFSVVSSTSVTISNFTIDYGQDALPFTQGTVISVDPGTSSFVLQIQDGFPSLDSSFFSGTEHRWGVLVDPTSPISKRNVTVSSQLITRSWDSLPEPNQFRMYVPNDIGVGDASPGDRFVQVARYAGSALHFLYSKDITVQGMVIYAANVQAVASTGGSGNIIIENNTVTTSPDSGRYHSINGGAFIIQDQRGAIRIFKNSTQGGTDDSVNIYTTAMDVISVSDSSPSVVVSNTDIEPFPILIAVGDEMQFVQTTTGQVLGTATVTSVSSTQKDGFWYYTLGLSSPVAGVVPDPNGKPPSALGTYYTGTTVFDLALAGTSTITNNTFNNTLWGMNVRSCNLDCNISNNTFYLTGNGINLEADFDQLQGPVPDNVSITGNRFSGGTINTMGYSGPGPYAYQALIGNFMATPAPDGVHMQMMPSSYKGPQNVTVSSNSFSDSDAESILITGAQNISLKNNSISASGKLPRQDTGGAGASVAEASGIRVNGLTVKDTRPQTKEALEIADTVPCGQYPTGISTSKVSFNGSAANAILDERKCGD